MADTNHSRLLKLCGISSYTGATTTTTTAAVTNYSEVYEWKYSCDKHLREDFDWALGFVVLFSLIILLFLSVRSDKKRWWCCWGRPGTLYPMNMLDGYENRLAYSVLFGSMTYELMNVLYSPENRLTVFGISYWLQFIPTVQQYPVIRLMILLCQVAIVALIYYPLFAALSSKYRVWGSLVGLSNSLLRIVMWLYTCTCISTADDPEALRQAGLSNMAVLVAYIIPILLWPGILCMLILSACYVQIIVRSIREKKFGYDSAPEPIALEHHIEHVRVLLRKERLPWSNLLTPSHHLSVFNKEKLMTHFSPARIPGFKFPTRVIATFVITVLGVYQIGTEIISLVYVYLQIVSKYLECGQFLLPAQLLPLFEMLIQPYLELVRKYITIATDAWVGLLVIDCLLAVFTVYHSCLSYRKHTLRVYSGDRSMFPKSWIRQTTPAIITAASRHAGLQIAYNIWGFIIIHVFIYLIVMGVILVIIMPPLEFGYWGLIIRLSQTVIASLILNQIFYWMQFLLNRFLFIQDKTNADDEQFPMSLDNRRAWYNVSYFFFFWTLFLGIISALLRIVRGMLMGIFFIPRIDRPVLLKGFETMDNGYVAYLSLLTTINAHDHPVVKVFIKILHDNLEQRRKHEQKQINSTSKISDQEASVEGGAKQRNNYKGSKRAKYYWSLAYTLINNPDLLVYRKLDDDEQSDTQADIPNKKIRKHKIVLAIQRKKRGDKTSDLYFDPDNELQLEENHSYIQTDNSAYVHSHDHLNGMNRRYKTSSDKLDETTNL